MHITLFTIESCTRNARAPRELCGRALCVTPGDAQHSFVLELDGDGWHSALLLSLDFGLPVYLHCREERRLRVSEERKLCEGLGFADLGNLLQANFTSRAVLAAQFLYCGIERA